MMDLSQAAPVMRPMGGFLTLTLIFVAAEFVYARLSCHDEDHDLAETAASIGVALGDLGVRIPTGGLAARLCRPRTRLAGEAQDHIRSTLGVRSVAAARSAALKKSRAQGFSSIRA